MTDPSTNPPTVAHLFALYQTALADAHAQPSFDWADIPNARLADALAERIAATRPANAREAAMLVLLAAEQALPSPGDDPASRALAAAARFFARQLPLSPAYAATIGQALNQGGVMATTPCRHDNAPEGASQ